MEEAQALADRVAIIAHGRIVAQGSPGELAGRGGGAARISFRLPAGVAGADLPRKLAAVVGHGEVRLEADDPVPVLHELTSWALERRVPLRGLEVRRPSLEDVYLELTAGEREEGAEA
jgi:ABC-2 type transport system ATP-binding protein